MAVAGAALSEIMVAGGWRSPARCGGVDAGGQGGDQVHARSPAAVSPRFVIVSNYASKIAFNFC